MQQRAGRRRTPRPPPHAPPRRPDPWRCPAADRARPPGRRRPRRARGNAGSRCPGARTTNTGPSTARTSDPHRPPQQRRAVPFQARLRGAHADRAAADEDDPGHEWATVGHSDGRTRPPRSSSTPEGQSLDGADRTGRADGRVRTSAGVHRPPDERGPRSEARTSEAQLTTVGPDRAAAARRSRTAWPFMARWSLRLALIGLGCALLLVADRPAVGDRDAGPAGPADHHRALAARRWLRRRGCPPALAAAAVLLGALLLLGPGRASSSRRPSPGGVAEIATSAVGGHPVDPELDRRPAAQHRRDAVRRAAAAGHAAAAEQRHDHRHAAC